MHFEDSKNGREYGGQYVKGVMHGTCYSIDPTIEEEWFGKCVKGLPNGMGYETNSKLTDVYHGEFCDK